MKKKFLKIIAVSSLLLAGGGVIAMNQMHDVVMQAKADTYSNLNYNGGDSIPSGYYTSADNSSNSNRLSIAKGNDVNYINLNGSLSDSNPTIDTTKDDASAFSGGKKVLGFVITEAVNVSVTFYNGSTSSKSFCVYPYNSVTKQFDTANAVYNKASKPTSGYKWSDTFTIDGKAKYYVFKSGSSSTGIAKIEFTPIKTVFNANGGIFENASNTVTVSKENGKITPPSYPTRDGYVCVGWAESSTGTNAVSDYVAGGTYYAIWEIDQTLAVRADSITIDQEDQIWNPAQGNLQLTISYTSKTGKNVNIFPELSWSSNNEKVLTVDSEGKLKNVGVGVATVTVTANYDNESILTDSVNITINQKFVDASDKIFKVDDTTIYTSHDFFNDKSFIYHTKKTGSKAMTFDKLSLTNYFQDTFAKDENGNITSGLEINLSRPATVSLYFTATGNKSGRVTGIYEKTTNTAVKTIDCNQQTAHILTADLNAGQYYLTTFENGTSEVPVNFYGGEVKYAGVNYDTQVHLACQPGMLYGARALKFIGWIDKKALNNIEVTYFDISLNSETPIKTEERTTVYTSISYYGKDGSLIEYAPDANSYYFAFTLTNIPEDFVGTFTANAYARDIDGTTYKTSGSAEVEFTNDGKVLVNGQEL